MLKVLIHRQRQEFLPSLPGQLPAALLQVLCKEGIEALAFKPDLFASDEWC